jgi:GntR family transcriptional regulator / MocR family aminotransferase
MRRDIVFEITKNSELQEEQTRAIFLNLANVIVRDIQRGRLKPNDPLPGTRVLAKNLGIHRNTVVAAYEELVTQGWLVTHPAQGTFVASDLPSELISAPAPNKAPGEGSDSPLPAIHVTDGTADARLIPHTELGRAFRHALVAPAFLAGGGYGNPQGSSTLRAALADYLAISRGVAASKEEILVTRGSQMALYVVGRALLSPNDTLAIEDPGYPLAYSAFKATGADVVGIPVDQDGIVVDRLSEAATRLPNLKAVYVTPHHQYPTTVTMSGERRAALLALCQQRGLTIIEDDYDHEFHFDGQPVLPLAGRNSGNANVIYIGSLSKLLSPGLRLGYAVCRSSSQMQAMIDSCLIIDRQGDVPVEYAVASLIADGDLRRHTLKARVVYRARRDLLAQEIRKALGASVDFDLPNGGLALWLRLGDVDDRLWADRAKGAGLVIAAGSRCFLRPDVAVSSFRVGFASLDEAEIHRVAELLAASRP